MNNSTNKTVMLIDFYSAGSLGLRYLENALEAHGFTVKMVFLKTYDNIHPEKVTEEEHELLREFIRAEKPVIIGISMITSFYVELVEYVTGYIREMGVPMVSGGIYATLSPDKCLAFTDYVIRGEGGEPLCELATALGMAAENGGTENIGLENIQNLVYRNASSEMILNPMRPLLEDMDVFGFPRVDTGNEWLIDKNKIRNIEPQKREYAYTISASRGCYFHCSYCGSVNLQRVQKGLGPHVRVRKVESVIEELVQAKKKMKNLIHIRFVDGVFPIDKEWVAEFAAAYKEKVNLPFKIWVHPRTTDFDSIKVLRRAGLYKLIMGIQSGSPQVRNEVFLRPETQEHILAASKVYADNRVPLVEYDFILCHPFETVETIKESYDVCMNLSGRFLLNINGLKFMPETEIVNIAVAKGIFTMEEFEASLNAPLEDQFDFLRLDEYSRNNSADVNLWYKLVYLTQFRTLRRRVRKFATNPVKYTKRINRNFKMGMRFKQLRRYTHIARMVIKGKLARWFGR